MNKTDAFDFDTFAEKRSVRAVIREDECIGCAKCLSACPIDAIVGAPKFMHTIIETDCTGCELCITPCPVDCIELTETKQTHRFSKDELWERHQHHVKRQAQTREAFEAHYQWAKNAYQVVDSPEEAIKARQQAIRESVARVKKQRKS